MPLRRCICTDNATFRIRRSEQRFFSDDKDSRTILVAHEFSWSDFARKVHLGTPQADRRTDSKSPRGLGVRSRGKNVGEKISPRNCAGP